MVSPFHLVQNFQAFKTAALRLTLIERTVLSFKTTSSSVSLYVVDIDYAVC